MSKSILREIERERSRQPRKSPPKATSKELLLTFLISIFVTPFFAILVSVLPMIGQIIFFVVMSLTAYYLFIRRSFSVFFTAVFGSFLVAVVTFLTIQSIKYHIEIPLFIFLVLGVPVSAIYSMMIGMRIWKLLDRDAI